MGQINNIAVELGQVWRKIGDRYDFRIDTEYDFMMIENYPHKYEFLYENREVQKIATEAWLTEIRNYIFKMKDKS